MFEPNENSTPEVVEVHSGVRGQAVTSPKFLSGAFTYFGAALCISALGAWVGLTYGQYIFVSRGVMFAAIITELILMFTAHIWSRKYPLGYWMFAAFAFISGITLVPILVLAGATGGIGLVIRALGACTATFVAAALFARTTSRNLLGMGGFLTISLIGLIVMSLIGLFIPWNSTVEIVFSGVSILIFTGFTMYDIQLLSRVQGLNPLLAGIRLYLDFINLFISFLRLLMALKRD
jgi:FtsH-binding integral membrane protein